MITFSHEAFAILTQKQRDRLDSVLSRFNTKDMMIHVAFDLPEGYVAFTLNYGGDNQLSGGIDPDGVVST